MREIKFRGWDKIEKRWKYFNSNVWSIEGGNHINPTFETENNDKILKLNSIFYSNYQNNNIEWHQYTNLKDKNSIEIYDNDIIKWNDTNTIVRYSIDDGGWVIDNNIPGQYGVEVFDYSNAINSEVIGNIYDNPELLEK